MTTGPSRNDLPAWLDRTERSVPPTFAQTLDLFDVELQHSLAPRGRHAVAWGINHRRSRDRVTNSPYFAFLPARLQQRWSSLYVQDEISFADGEFRLIPAVRVDYYKLDPELDPIFATDNPGVAVADLELSAVAEARGRVPALANARPFSLSVNDTGAS